MPSLLDLSALGTETLLAAGTGLSAVTPRWQGRQRGGGAALCSGGVRFRGGQSPAVGGPCTQRKDVPHTTALRTAPSKPAPQFSSQGVPMPRSGYLGLFNAEHWL